VEQIEKPLTKRQREELKGIIAPSTQILRVALFTACAAAVGSAFRWAQFLVTDSMPIWLIPTGLLLVWIYLKSGEWTGGRELRRKVREDLEIGHLIMTILEPRTVDEVEEHENEGPSYIIDNIDGSVFLLTGQEMERYQSKKFPWAKIGVLETPRSKQFLGLKRLGAPITVAKKRPPFAYQEAKELGCFNSNFIQLDESRMQLLGGTEHASIE